jgi:thiol-disulfide isomerase/thioredoxin
MRSIFFRWTRAVLVGSLFVLFFSVLSDGQAKSPSNLPADAAGPRVVQIDEAALKVLLKPKGKPLLINFWATWCDPCREEFPDLVQLDKEYKGKIDFLTVSLDDPEDIKTAVPKFLASMKAEMPAYLLKTADESAVIGSISKDWHGGMPFTALYSPSGEMIYFREGKVILETLKAELNRLTAPAPAGKDALE